MWRLLITAVKYSLDQSQLYELLVTKTPIVCCPISIQIINKITEECHRGHSLAACNDALNATLPRSVFFSIEPKSGLYRSVFTKIIGPYEVCIFVNIGPFEKMGALE